METAIYAMVFLGSALMVFNIFGFISFVHKVRAMEKSLVNKKNAVLYIPVVLLVLFLLGYLAVGIFGSPDLIVSGILFGGSIFVFVMYIMPVRNIIREAYIIRDCIERLSLQKPRLGDTV